jgi:hypothetical protein
VLQACVRQWPDLAQMLADVTLFPQVLINVRLRRRRTGAPTPCLAAEQQAVAAELGDSGRLLIRASGTEPLLRVMVEVILELSSDVFVARMAGCDAFQVRMIHATGGLIRPVMLRVTLDPSPEFPLVERELVFRSIYSNFSFGDSLHGLATGRWAFNPFNVYSARTFTLTF